MVERILERNNTMKQQPNDRQSKASTSRYWPIGVGFGTAVGAGIGAATGNIATGVGMGIALGTAVGLVLSRQGESKSGDS
jgi:hypothetical protein